MQNKIYLFLENVKEEGIIGLQHGKTAGKAFFLIINACLIKQKSVKNPTYEDLKKADLQARLLTKQMILKGGY